VRELHWHPDAAEWALVLEGTCVTTMLDLEGKGASNVLHRGDVWYFPRSIPHAIVAGADGCKAVLAFNSGEYIPDDDFGMSQLVQNFPAAQVRGFYLRVSRTRRKEDTHRPGCWSGRRARAR
jgi:oxalate decarboxylase